MSCDRMGNKELIAKTVSESEKCDKGEVRHVTQIWHPMLGLKKELSKMTTYVSSWGRLR